MVVLVRLKSFSHFFKLLTSKVCVNNSNAIISYHLNKKLPFQLSACEPGTQNWNIKRH